MNKEITQGPEYKLITMLETDNSGFSPFHICKQLSTHIRELLGKGAESEIMYYIGRVYAIYCHTTIKHIRTAIEKVFVYRTGTNIMANKDRYELLYTMPIHFRNILTKQMMSAAT